MPKLLWKSKGLDDAEEPIEFSGSHDDLLNGHVFSNGRDEDLAEIRVSSEPTKHSDIFWKSDSSSSPHIFMNNNNIPANSLGLYESTKHGVPYDLSKTLGNPLETHRSYSNMEITRSITPSKPLHMRSNSINSSLSKSTGSNSKTSTPFRSAIPTPTYHAQHHSRVTQPLAIIQPNGAQHRNIFDVEEQNEDITKAAAQREQQKGSGRHIRGTMGPVLGKEEDNTQARKFSKVAESITKKQIRPSASESFLASAASQSLRSVLEPGDTLIAIEVIQKVPDGMRSVNGMESEFKDLAAKISRGDIMTQSLRRQSRKASKGSVNESPIKKGSGVLTKAGNNEEFFMFNPAEINFSISDVNSLHRKASDSRRSRKSLQHSHPNAREDVQILNLQGFMDSNNINGVDDNENSYDNEIKRKSKRRRSRKGSDPTLGVPGNHISRDRRKRSTRHKNNSNDIALKDLDELDDQFSGILIGPKPKSNHSTGIPIIIEDAIELRKLLTGNPAVPLPPEWMTQNFQMNPKSNLSYGLVQKKGGPCGVLASVQAHMLKGLMFGSSVSPEISSASPLRPSNKEWRWAVSVAITEILWRAGDQRKAVIALPSAFPHFTDYGVGRYQPDGLTENLSLHTFTKVTELLVAVENNLSSFINTDAPGCVLLLYSSLLTRGLDNVLADMDAGSSQLINSHNYASQEVVNLLITGRASTNTFDGDATLGGTVTSSTEEGPSKLTLRGIHSKADIGLMSLFEHYGSCKVGNHLKSPQYPLWVICSESHYTCLFSRHSSLSSTTPITGHFDVYYYDGLAQQEDEIRITIKFGEEVVDDQPRPLIPPLELCIRTKWPAVILDWNGTDPLL